MSPSTKLRRSPVSEGDADAQVVDKGAGRLEKAKFLFCSWGWNENKNKNLKYGAVCYKESGEGDVIISSPYPRTGDGANHPRTSWANMPNYTAFHEGFYKRCPR